MTQPLTTKARRYLRLARQEIDVSRLEAVRILDSKASTLDGAVNAFSARLLRAGPVKVKAELEKLNAALNRITCCAASFRSSSSRKHNLFAIIPCMEARSIEEPELITMDGLYAQCTRRGHCIEVHVYGAISSHAIGRIAERSDLVPEDAPRIVRHAGMASLLIPSEVERSIALRIGRAGHDDDLFLVGALRRDR